MANADTSRPDASGSDASGSVASGRGLSGDAAGPDRVDLDVVIIGAGLSGIGAAWHLQTRLPDTRFVLLEARGAIGGTWDLFRYPGVRSDSDMFTLGYRFRPWSDAKIIADGPAIRHYVRETAAAHGIDRKIHFSTRVTALNWSGAHARWTIRTQTPDEERVYTARFVWNCAGYYRYSAGFMPDFPGVESFAGPVIHPQNWPEGLDYTGKRVVIIGSGATAVTLAPAMTDKAAHVVMLQRSPTYMFAMPGTSAAARTLSRILPTGGVYALMRWWRIVFQNIMFKLARAYPKTMGQRLIDQARDLLPAGYDVEKHFTPSYNPWDQRICVVPDNDLFDGISRGAITMVTDHIERIDSGGIHLKSGDYLEADIIVTATGLVLEAFGGAALSVDGRAVALNETFTYKGHMFDGLPNIVSVFGYTNASWTLRADLVSDHTCRLLAYMSRHGFDVVTPHLADKSQPGEPYLDFSAGYVTRAHDVLPKQGRAPWRHPQDYFRDLFALRYGRLNDGALQFTRSDHASSK